jgi:hypothetical protein
LSVNRERLDRLDITRKFSDRIVVMAMDAGLVSEEQFSADGTGMQAPIQHAVKEPSPPHPSRATVGPRCAKIQGMRVRPDRQTNLFAAINLEDLFPADHRLRPIERVADEALAAMSRTFAAACALSDKGGRPSVPPPPRPERLLKAMILMSL